jgi:hypothetical protein
MPHDRDPQKVSTPFRNREKPYFYRGKHWNFSNAVFKIASARAIERDEVHSIAHARIANFRIRFSEGGR